jgi:MYND finger
VDSVLYGRWERYPREFAKGRRCRNAKYCGKECQSAAWIERLRFWCSVKDGDDDADSTEQQSASTDTVPSATTVFVTGGGRGCALAVTTGDSVTGLAEAWIS